MLDNERIYVTSVLGNSQLLDGGAMFGNAPRSMWERWMTPDSQGRIPLACRCLLIEFGGQKILCELGIGAYMNPVLAARYGVQESQHVLLENLARLGIDPSEIDTIILSHLHFDHVGGLLPSFSETADPLKPFAFPNAQVLVGSEAWQRACQPHDRDRASFIPGLTEALQASGKLLIIEQNEIDLGGLKISFRKTQGHTPGQLHVLVQGTKQTIFFAGDLIPGLPWLHVPITMGYDRFAELVIDEKIALYESAVEQKWLIFFTHDATVAASTIRREGHRILPDQQYPELCRYPL